MPNVNQVTDAFELGLHSFAGFAAVAFLDAQQRSRDVAVASLASRIVAERHAIAAVNRRAARAEATADDHRRRLMLRAAAARAARG